VILETEMLHCDGELGWVGMGWDGFVYAFWLKEYMG